MDEYITNVNPKHKSTNINRLYYEVQDPVDLNLLNDEGGSLFSWNSYSTVVYNFIHIISQSLRSL